MQKSVRGLEDPFRQQILPHLPLSALAHLRATCRDLKWLVDEQSASVWTSAAASVLQAETLPSSANSEAIRVRLQQHAEILKRLASGVVTQSTDGFFSWNNRKACMI